MYTVYNIDQVIFVVSCSIGESDVVLYMQLRTSLKGDKNDINE